jgi:spore cortex biosynthesis protein YabQ
LNLETFLTVTKQTELFFLSVVIGAALGVLFDATRIIRIIIRKSGNAFFCALTDILFMLFAAFCIFIFSAESARGQVRFFVVLGALLGFTLEILTIGDVITHMVRKAANSVRAGLTRIVNGIKSLQKVQQTDKEIV